MNGKLSRLAMLALACLAACGGEASQPTGVENLSALSGDSIGVVTLDGLPSLALRFVLQEGAGMDSRALGGEVRYSEVSADSLADMLESGEVEGALLPPAVAYSLRDEPAYQVRTHISQAMADITDSAIISTALLVARDEAVRRNDALAEARRMLRESTTYFESNKDSVLETVAREQALDAEYIEWLSARQRPVLGDSSTGAQEALADLWAAAVETGDLTAAPDLASVFFADSDEESHAGRETVSVAVLDDGLHRGALFAIENGFVASERVDIAVTYLTPSGLTQAINAGEYDVVEASPLLVVTAQRARLDLVVLSGGVRDTDSMLLFDYVSTR